MCAGVSGCVRVCVCVYVCVRACGFGFLCVCVVCVGLVGWSVGQSVGRLVD